MCSTEQTAAGLMAVQGTVMAMAMVMAAGMAMADTLAMAGIKRTERRYNYGRKDTGIRFDEKI